MTNKELIQRHLQFVYPREVTNSDLVKATSIQPHQQVFLITRQLRELGLITARRLGKEWYFKAKPAADTPTQASDAAVGPMNIAFDPVAETVEVMGAASFEQMARKVFSIHFATELNVGSLAGIPKKWDMLSSEGSIVGDAKYYTLVGGISLPPAKFATIADYVWLLEKTNATTKFLVFGNQIEVPQMWLSKYGSLVKDVQFYFLDDNGVITQLN